MSYVMINGETEHYNVTEIMPFTTQHGFEAIRFTGDEIPETNKGFKFYDDEDNLISDLSDYTNLYRQNEYSVEEDIIVPPDWTDAPLPTSIFSTINSRINKINSQVYAITPYEKTKKAYYGEIEKVFYNVPDGNTSIFFDNFNGEYSFDRIEDRLTIRFAERLECMTNVTVMVNK